MVKNYLKIAYRNFLRNKLFTVINVSGMGLGMAVGLILLLYVGNELNYDKFHEKKDRIYRVLTTIERQNEFSKYAIITAAVAPGIQSEYKEIIDFTRFSSSRDGFFNYGSKSIKTDYISYVDTSFFDIFSFKLIKGNPDEALRDPKSIVLTESLANSIFGEEDPVGKNLQFNTQEELFVTGIVEDPPSNSQLRFDALIAFSNLLDKKVFLGWDGGWSYYSYVLLDEHANIDNLYRQFPKLLDEKINYKVKEHGIEYGIELEPLEDVHLFSTAKASLPTKGSLNNIYIFSSAAFIILLMACINFMSLTTVQSSKRSKEIGIRKVAGAAKSSLRFQFLTESLLITFISFGFALLFLIIFQSSIEQLIGFELSLLYFSNLRIALFIVLLLILTGFISGTYPAFYLSGFKPVKAMKGDLKSSAGKPGFVNGIVTFQYTISIILIICTITVYKQLDFIKNKELGYNKENTLVLPLYSFEVRDNYMVLKNELTKLPGVISSGASSAFPGGGFTSNGYFPEGYKDPVMLHALDIEPDFLETMGIEIVQGRNFMPEMTSDKEKFLVNESLIDFLGWNEPIGKTIERNNVKYEVIGVVKDFNFATLHEEIKPLVITLNPWNGYNYLSLKIHSSNLRTTMKELESKWKTLTAGEPFDYFFLDQAFDSYYKKEQQLGNIFFYFAVVAIAIGCLGLFGLVSFAVKDKVKEIGIRKVLGASTIGLIGLLSKNYALKVLLANLVAWPIAWYAMSEWLQNFYFRINLSWDILITAGVIAFLIALITVNYLTVKAAQQNPVKNLRYE